MPKESAKETSDAQERAMVDRLLEDLKSIADRDSYTLVEAYTNHILSSSTPKTASHFLRTLSTVLAEMGQGKPVRKLKERYKADDTGKIRTRFKPEVKAKSLTTISKRDIEAYFANLHRFGKTVARNYKQALRQLFLWLAEEAEDEGRDEKVRAWKSLVKGLGEIKQNYRDQSQTDTWDDVDVEKALDAIAKGATTDAVRDQALLALLWEGGLRPFEIQDLRVTSPFSIRVETN